MATYTLITGASAGLGAEFARLAARDKYNIILTARRSDRLNALADELREAGAGDVRVIVADLGDEAQVDRLWQDATEIGDIDVLVNNAGLGEYGSFLENDWWKERTMIGVNVIAATLLAKKAAAHMVGHGQKSRIINVASLAAFIPGPNMAVYHATKAYLLSLSEALSAELAGSKVTVTAVCPGATETEFQDVAGMEDVELVKRGMQSAKVVAREGWTGARAGQRVVVTGNMNKATAAFSRIVPNAVLLKMMRVAMGREGDGNPLDRVREMAERAKKKAEETRAQFTEEGGLADKIKAQASELRTRAHILGEKATADDGPLTRLREAADTAKSKVESGLSSASEAVTARANQAREKGLMNTEMAEQMRSGQGFIAALDQSGGSTPKALRQYGVSDDEWNGEEEMFDRIHEMRTRIVTSPAFTGDRVIGAILFEQTMDRDFEGKPAPQYLWEEKRVVPFLKCDKGLKDEENGVQLMKDMGDLATLLRRAKDKGVFGTKMRSVINAANRDGIKANIDQQFEIGHRILGYGLMPILEPEVNITIEDKAEAEGIMLDEILSHLSNMNQGTEIMLKLSLPTENGFFKPLIEHPNVMRVVALSGGYSREEANDLLAKNPGMIASFSRALAEGLSHQQSDDDFNATLGSSIDSIYRASIT